MIPSIVQVTDILGAVRSADSEGSHPHYCLLFLFTLPSSFAYFNFHSYAHMYAFAFPDLKETHRCSGYCSSLKTVRKGDLTA